MELNADVWFVERSSADCGGADGDGEALGEVTDGRVIVSSVDDGGADLRLHCLNLPRALHSPRPSPTPPVTHTHSRVATKLIKKKSESTGPQTLSAEYFRLSTF